jgi:hypothetical protein
MHSPAFVSVRVTKTTKHQQTRRDGFICGVNRKCARKGLLGHLGLERQRVKPCSWVGVKPDRQPDRSLLLLQTSMVVSLVGSRVVFAFGALRAKFRYASFRCLVVR